MATSPVQFISNTTVSDTAGALGSYATPAGYVDKLYEIILHNSHTVGVAVELWLVPSGGSRTAATKIFKKTLAVDETYILGVEQRLAAGAAIHGDASVASVVSVHASGDRVTA